MAKVAGIDIQSICDGFLELVLLGGAALYAGLVLTSRFGEGPQLRPHMDWSNPARSAERWAVWLGVQALTLALRLAAPVFGMLSEASADVGDWFLNHRHGASH
jgi:hypothetical protein